MSAYRRNFDVLSITNPCRIVIFLFSNIASQQSTLPSPKVAGLARSICETKIFVCLYLAWLNSLDDRALRIFSTRPLKLVPAIPTVRKPGLILPEPCCLIAVLQGHMEQHPEGSVVQVEERVFQASSRFPGEHLEVAQQQQR